MVPDCNFQFHYSGSQTPAHFVPLHPSPEETGGEMDSGWDLEGQGESGLFRQSRSVQAVGGQLRRVTQRHSTSIVTLCISHNHKSVFETVPVALFTTAKTWKQPKSLLT